MSTDTPRTDAIESLDRAARHKALWDLCTELERDNARLREEVEMLNVRHAASMLHAQTHADEYNALREDEKGLLQDIQRLTEEAFKRDEELAEAKEQHRMELAAVSSACFANSRTSAPPMEVTHPYWTQSYQDVVNAVAREMNQRERAEQAEARALAAENKVAWQEVETADLRDDVKRLHKTVSECEERALENQKDAGRYRWLRDSKNAYPLFFIAQRDPHNIVVQFSGELADMNIDAAVAGAKHD